MCAIGHAVNYFEYNPVEDQDLLREVEEACIKARCKNTANKTKAKPRLEGNFKVWTVDEVSLISVYEARCMPHLAKYLKGFRDCDGKRSMIDEVIIPAFSQNLQRDSIKPVWENCF